MSSQSQATVVVMEAGAAWPAWIEQCRPSADTCVIVQQEVDTPGEFADRVVGRVESLVARGVRIGAAVVACGERTDDTMLNARRSCASSILSAIAIGGPGGRVFFSASERSHGSARHALSTLAADMNEEWQSAGLVVSVRFGMQTRPPQELAALESVAPSARRVA